MWRSADKFVFYRIRISALCKKKAFEHGHPVPKSFFFSVGRINEEENEELLPTSASQHLWRHGSQRAGHNALKNNKVYFFCFLSVFLSGGSWPNRPTSRSTTDTHKSPGRPRYSHLPFGLLFETNFMERGTEGGVMRQLFWRDRGGTFASYVRSLGTQLLAWLWYENWAIFNLWLFLMLLVGDGNVVTGV